MATLSALLSSLDDFLWSILGITTLISLGLFLTWKFRCGQLIKFPTIVSHFWRSVCQKDDGCKDGVHPIKVFFASIGGCIGIGNLVAVCTAVKIGGPGAVLWIWVAAFLGMILKYCEVYLGLKFRVKNQEGGYDGGPMFFLQKAFKSKLLAVLAALLLAVYGTEVYMFNTVASLMSASLNIPSYMSIGFLLVAVVGVGLGGVSRAGAVCSAIIPFFLVIFVAIASYVLWQTSHMIGPAFASIFSSAFSGHAPIGGFAGAGIWLASTQGIARGCYTGDIGVGFASVIHAESKALDIKKQAGLAIFGVFLDTFVVCTLSLLLILATGIWHQDVAAAYMVQQALALYLPGVEWFMLVFLFLLGYSSMISFFCVGLKCAKFVFGKHAKLIYTSYAILSFIFFSQVEVELALTLMSISGASLLLINSWGIFRMRQEIEFLS